MNQTFTKILFASPWMLGVSLFLGGNAIAAESSVSAENQKPQAQVSEQPVASISNNNPGQLAQFAPMQLAQVPVNPTSSNSMGSIVPASPSMQTTGQSGQKNGTMSQMPSVSQLSAGQTPKTGAMSQVTSVSQLSDVQPTDWAFQALQSLVERYGCIAGYPDGTFKGNRALSRFEFAAGVNACLDQLTRQVGAATANFVTKDDLAILQRLQEEFAAELTALRGRIDVLDARTTELEANQFSTTTKLGGEAIFALSDTWGNRATQYGSKGQKDNTNTTLSDRVRLNFNTSFTGQDLLRTRLNASNIAAFDGGSNTRANLTGTNMTRLSFDGDNRNTFALDKLYYRFPAGKNAIVYVGPMGLALDDVADVVTPFNSDSQGSISRFGRRNPAVFRGREGAGAGLTYKFSDGFKVQVAYLANDATASNPSAGKGFFNSGYSAIGQFVFTNKNFDAGISYTHKYDGADVSIMGATGSYYANRPFRDAPTTSENVGLQFNWKLSPGFQFGGWAGYTTAHQQGKTVAGLQNGKTATILNGALTLAFPDLFAKGNLGGLILGVPPKVTSSDFYNTDGTKRKDNSTSLHLEAFYRVQVSDFVSVTPGVFVITNPENNSKNSSQVVGTLRTTFTF
jgi:hypothetical protein